MEKISRHQVPFPNTAVQNPWQDLLRHETLRLVKSGTFVQLISSPELAVLAMEYAEINRRLLDLFSNRLDSP